MYKHMGETLSSTSVLMLPSLGIIGDSSMLNFLSLFEMIWVMLLAMCNEEQVKQCVNLVRTWKIEGGKKWKREGM